MKILTWNINGIRTIPQYHPWNGLKSHKDILDKLDADIICFQEMKSSRQNLPKDVAIPPQYTSFFSFPTKKAGYSGVAIYAREQYTPRKAEDYLCGPPTTASADAESDRISQSLSSYPAHSAGQDDEIDWKLLDAEGRTLVADFGLFVLINVYCPNDGTDTSERIKYKMDFHRALSERVKRLMVDDGREVIVVGDLNAVADLRDHCEGALTLRKIVDEQRKEGQEITEREAEEIFYDAMPARRWLRDCLVEYGGPLLDVCRRFWPDRKGMYTCWNTKISARASNYGTRIDFILVTPGLLPLIKHADIQPDVKGSDHCPVVVELHDEVDVGSIPPSVKASLDAAQTLDATQDPLAKVPLRSLMAPPDTAPRLASKNWDEYSGKQRLLDGFFRGKTATAEGGGKGKAGKTKSKARPTLRASTSTPRVSTSTPRVSTSTPRVPTSASQTPDPASISPEPGSTASPAPQPPSEPPMTSSKPPTTSSKPPTAKRKSTSATPAPSKKQKVIEGEGQTKLSAFFAKPSASSKKPTPAPTPDERQAESAPLASQPDDDDQDYQFALELSRQYEDSGAKLVVASGSKPTVGPKGAAPSLSGTQRSPSTGSTSTSSWQDLLTAPPIPHCLVHDEPAREFVVNKKGENKGRACPRPVGPGYDKGRAERRREDVDPQFKCDFFKWKSDVRKEFNSRRGKG
ncbi:Endonuclease/exonuclease/phosphatase [Schizophyllum amplum]|uniref:DNA-(apurinic or apyrimidinic site) endonuclease n=1 Tax=Schizophyllum amplum TaxID=97359 RepID=A0A550BZW3_9AGAR|nr:Endonuclease/exonuclease/phosphatase [Auriculariopsis ampla]